MSLKILLIALVWAVIWSLGIQRCPGAQEDFYGHPIYLGETQVPAYQLDHIHPWDRPAFGTRWVRPGQGVPRYCGQCGDQSYGSCRSCADCGYCVSRGYGECVPGDERGPYFREDCEYWEYLPPRYYSTPHHRRSLIFPPLRIHRHRRFRPRGWRFWNWFDPVEEVILEEEEISPESTPVEE